MLFAAILAVTMLASLPPASELLAPPELIVEYLERRGWTADALQDESYILPAKGAQGARPVTLDDVEIDIINSDPVLWGETCLVEEDGETLWRLWDYQIDSARLRVPKILKCGGEVGKTRGMSHEMLWRAAVFGRSQLCAAALDGHLESIWQILKFQIERSPFLKPMIADSVKKPYRHIRFKSGACIDLRPVGINGKALRGMHPHDICMDEADCVKNSDAWDELVRARKPDGEFMIASTPTGDRRTRFHRLVSRGIPIEEFKRTHPERFHPLNILPPGDPRSARVTAGRFVVVRWGKDLAPAPFWTEHRAAEFREQYGGERSPGYQRLVLGNDGDLADSVWSYSLMAKTCQYMKRYRHIELRADEDGNVHLWVRKLNPSFAAKGESGSDDEGFAETIDLVEGERVEGLDRGFTSAEWLDVLRPHLPKLRGRVVVGSDLGWTQDPTEVAFCEVSGPFDLVWPLRVTLRGFETAQPQAAIFAALDELLSPSEGWGIDIGGLGGTLEKQLGIEGSSIPPERRTGFAPGGRTESRNTEDGQVAKDSRGRPRTTPEKALATELVTAVLTSGQAEFPLQADIISEFSSHQQGSTKKGEPKYSDGSDHTIDAIRWALRRWFERRVGLPGAEVPTPMIRKPRRRTTNKQLARLHKRSTL